MQRIMNNQMKFFVPFISLNNKAMKSVTTEGQQFVIGNVIDWLIVFVAMKKAVLLIVHKTPKITFSLN